MEQHGLEEEENWDSSKIDEKILDNPKAPKAVLK